MLSWLLFTAMMISAAVGWCILKNPASRKELKMITLPYGCASIVAFFLFLLAIPVITYLLLAYALIQVIVVGIYGWIAVFKRR